MIRTVEAVIDENGNVRLLEPVHPSPYTSKSYGDARAVQLDAVDFVKSSLRVTSYARPGKLFTANRDLITSEVGALNPESLKRLVYAVVDLLRAGG